MQAQTSPSDPTRASAVWVTGTGAFLLLAAAATFVAVRWEQIPDQAKLGLLGLLTGTFLAAGHRLRPTLPATAGALFHLGTFLVPIDVAAVGVHLGFAWDRMLLVQALIAVPTFAAAARAQQSVVLRWSTWVAVVALAGGIGASTALPAPAVLAAIALGAVLLGHERAGGCWAAVAGLGPAVALACGGASVTTIGVGVLERLGLAGDHGLLSGMVTGGLAAAALVLVATRRRDAAIAYLAAGVAVAGLGATHAGVAPRPSVTLVAAAALFVAVEAIAAALRADEFWAWITAHVAATAEVIAAPFALAATTTLLALPGLSVEVDPAGALAAALAGTAWLVAGGRRGSAFWPSLPLAAVHGALAATLLTGDPLADAAALAGMALALGWATLEQRAAPVGMGTAAGLVLWAPVLAERNDLCTVAVSVAGVAALAAAAIGLRAPRQGDRPGVAIRPYALAIASIALLIPAAIATADLIGSTLASAALAITGATVLAGALDRANARLGPLPLGSLARLATPLAVLWFGTVEPVEAMGIGLVILAASIVDSVRLDRPLFAAPAMIALPLTLAAGSLASGATAAATGVTLTVAALALTGVLVLWASPAAGSLRIPGRWADAVLLSTAGCATSGLFLAAADRARTGEALLVVGGGLLLAALGGLARQHAVPTILASGVALTLGTWVRLDVAGVQSSEPYLAPVVLALLALSLTTGERTGSSWISYGPAIALAGGSVFGERIAGGGTGHALVAAAVGVAAVVAGGARRMAAPLLLGTLLLVALVGYETFAVVATTPTWIWLATGGATLLGSGMAMERRDTGPLETGRRLVDVVRTNFD